MKAAATTLAFSLLAAAVVTAQSSTDLFYIPKGHKQRMAALLILSCTGATQADLDSCRAVADSLGWALASCAKSRNHRDSRFNDYDIMATYATLTANYPVDRKRVFIYGFSGQGVQALMAVFLHPEAFRGAVSVCGHDGGMDLARREALEGKLFYLVTRKDDWNREANVRMDAAFRQSGAKDTLVVTRGKHEPRGFREVFQGCRWLDCNSK